MVETFGPITAYHDMINDRYNPQNFVGRTWLIEEATRFRDDKGRRSLIIVGEPGSGKSTFLAYLAEFWNCPRHFIRVDNRNGVAGVAPRAFLISLGSQLYEKYGPDIFERGISGSTHVTVGRAKDQAEVIGRFVDELYTLPFLPLQRDDVQVKVGVATGHSKVLGERVRCLVDVTLALDELTLLHVALINPVRKIQELYPDEKVVILVDALDESIQHAGKTSILDVLPLPTDAEFPSNLRMVMASRNESYLSRYSSSDLLYLDDKKKGYWQANQQDIRGYIDKRLAKAPFADTIATWKFEEIDDYVAQVVEHSQNNFLYLYHFFNELAASIESNHTDLRIFSIPKGLSEIYRSFAVEKIRQNVDSTIHITTAEEIPISLLAQLQTLPHVSAVKIVDRDMFLTTVDSDRLTTVLFPLLLSIGVQITRFQTQKAEQLGVWEEKYLPILGVVAVAYEPLYREQIAGFARVEVIYVDSVLARLKQFLNEVVDERAVAYHFYHHSFSEYLLDSQRNRDYLLDRLKYHAQIASYYREKRAIWQVVKSDLTEQSRREYGLKYYITHLFQTQEWQWFFAGLDTVEYGQAKLRFDPSAYSFAQDLELGQRAAMSEEWTLDEGIDQLPHLWQYTLLRFSLSSRADLYPPSAFRLLVLLGHKQETLDLVELLTNPSHQIHILLQIANFLLEQDNGEAESHLLLVRAYKKWQQTSQDVQEVVGFELITSLIKTQQWEMVESVIATGDDFSLQDGEWSDLSSRLVQAEQWKQAQSVLHFIKDGYARDRALCKLSETLALKDWDRGLKIISTIQHKDFHVQALCQFGTILTARQEHKQAKTMWAEAEKIIDTIEDAESRQHALQALCMSLLEAERWEWAENISSSLKNKQQRTHALKELGLGLVRIQQWTQAERIILSIEPEDASEWWLDLRPFGELSERTKALQELGQLLAEARQWEPAERVIRAIQDADVQVKELKKLALSLARAQQWVQAEHVIRAIEDTDVQAAELTCLALSQARHWEQIKNIIRSVESFDTQIKFWFRDAITSTWVQQWERVQSALAEIDRTQKAIENSEARTQLLDTGLHELTIALIQAQQWQLAEHTSHRIENPDTRTSLLQQLSTALIQARQWQLAENVLDTLETGDSKNQTLAHLSIQLAQAQKWEQAQRVCHRLEYVHNRAVMFGRLGALAAEAEQWTQATSLWTEAEVLINGIEDSYLQAWAFSQLIISFVEAGEVERAVNMYSRAVGIIPTIEGRNSNSWAEFLPAESPEWLANLIFSEGTSTIGDRITQNEAWHNLALALIEVQWWKEAESAIDHIEIVPDYSFVKGRISMRHHTLEAFARALIQANQWEHAERIINKLEHEVQQGRPIDRHDFSISLLNELAYGFLMAQQWQQAERISRVLEEKSTHLPDAWWNNITLELRENNLLIWCAVAPSHFRELFPYSSSKNEQWPHRKKSDHLLNNNSEFRDNERDLEKGMLIKPHERKTRANTWWELGVKLASLGHLQEAEEVCEIAKTLTYTLEAYTLGKEGKKGDEALIALAQAFMHMQSWDEASQIILTLTDRQTQVEAWKIFITVLIEYKEWERAISILPLCKKDYGELSIRNLYNKTYEELKTALIQEREWKYALRIINIGGDVPRDEELRYLCGVLIGQHEWNEVLNISLREYSDPFYRLISLRWLAHEFVNAREWWQVGRVLPKLDYEGVESVLEELAFALACLHKSGPGETLLPLQDEALRIQALRDLAHVQPLAQEGEQKEEDETSFGWTKFDELGIQFSSYSRILYEQAWQLGYLGTLLTQNQEDAATLWEKIEAVLDTHLLQWPRARMNKWPSKVYSRLSTIFIQAQQWDLAERSIPLIQEAEICFGASKELFKTLLQACEWDRAEEIIFTSEKSPVLTRELIQALLEAKEITLLMKLLNNSGHSSIIKTDDLEKACKCLIDLRAWEHAESVIEVIIDRKEFIAIPSENYTKLQAQKGGYPTGQEPCSCKEGEKLCCYHAHKFRLLQKRLHIRRRPAQRDVKISQPSTRLRNEPGKVQVEAHQQEWMSLKEREEIRVQALIQLVEALMPFIPEKRTEQILHRIISLRLSPFPIHGLSHLFARLINIQGKKIFEPLFDAIEQDDSGARFWYLLSRELAQMQTYEHAATALDRAETIILVLEDNGSEDVLYDQVGALVALGKWERTETIIQQVKKAEVRNLVWRNLAIALAEAKQWEDAERVTERIDDPGLYIGTYEALAKLMNANGDHQRLLHLIQNALWKVTTREEALAYFPLITTSISYRPAISIAFFKAFSWVEAFLRN